MKNLLLAGVVLGSLVMTGCATCEKAEKCEKAAVKEPFGYVISTTPTPRHRFSEPYNGWHKRYDAKRKQIADAKNQIDVVFIGDSITHGWENRASMEILKKHFPQHEILNLSHAGDRTEHQLWMAGESGFLQPSGAYKGINPKLIVVLIGTNNIGHRTAGPEATAAGIKLIVEALRKNCPEAKILLFGVFPRAQNPDHVFRGQVKEINQIICTLADGENVFYEDIAGKLLEKDGTLSKKIMPDYLHLSPAGYEIWAQAIELYVKRFAPKE